MSGKTEQRKYKLLGYEDNRNSAVIMVMSTGTVIRIKLSELVKSGMLDDLTQAEMRDIFRKYYSAGSISTVYDLSDRHERSWMVFVILNLLLFGLYVLANFAAAKLVYFEIFDFVTTPAVVLYPLTFLIVDLLNEFYGLKLARRAILFVIVSNALIVIFLVVSTYLPNSSGWYLNGPYDDVVGHVSSALVASSTAFLCSEYINSYLLCKIKELTRSRYLFLRVFLSTFFAVIIDSFIFCFIAFYGVMSNTSILGLVYFQITIKMCFAVFNILPAYGARWLFRKYVVTAPAA